MFFEVQNNSFQKVRKSQLFLKISLLFFISALIVCLRLHCASEPLERDITTYGYIAHQMLEGQKLYSELWDHKPPAIYLLFMAGESIFGYNQLSITAMGIIFSLVSCVFLYLFLNRISNSATAMLGVSFWAFASNSIALQANQPNVELFMNAFAIMGIWAFSYLNQKLFSRLFLAGVFFALATFCKMIAVFPIVFLSLYLLLPHNTEAEEQKNYRERIGHVFIFLLPVFLLWMLTFGYFWLSGRFSDFWGAVFTYNRYYTQNIFKNISDSFLLPEKMFNSSLVEIWVLVLLSIAWLGTSIKKYAYLRSSFFIFFLFGTYLAVASPGYSFPHYYQLLLPPFCIMASLFFYDAFSVVKSRSLSRAILVFIAISALALTGGHQLKLLRMSPQEISIQKYGRLFTQSCKIAEFVKNITSPDDEIYVWGAETGIYYYSKRKAASGLIYIYPVLTGPMDKRMEKKRRIFDDVMASMPSVFIFNEAYGKLEENYFDQYLKQCYTLIKKSGKYLIFKANNKREETESSSFGLSLSEDYTRIARGLSKSYCRFPILYLFFG